MPNKVQESTIGALFEMRGVVANVFISTEEKVLQSNQCFTGSDVCPFLAMVSNETFCQKRKLII